ncbi:hypothetical protein FRC11_003697, partial [Ceratobasidium sp. 423]
MVPIASISDPIYQYFHDITTPNGDHTSWTFHQAYLNCFHAHPKDQPEIGNVMQGEYGMGLIVSCLEEFNNHSATTTNDLKLISQDIQELLDLIHQ